VGISGIGFSKIWWKGVRKRSVGPTECYYYFGLLRSRIRAHNVIDHKFSISTLSRYKGMRDENHYTAGLLLGTATELKPRSGAFCWYYKGWTYITTPSLLRN